MDISRKVREEFNAISKEVFGVSSRWQQFYKGVDELVTKTVKEEVPPAKEGDEVTFKEVKVPVLLDGAKQFKRKYYTEDEIRTLLLGAKTQKDAILAQMKAAEDKRRADAELKQTQEEVQRLAAGQTSV